MFAGMAIRMAQDLGLHHLPDTDLDPSACFHDAARPSLDGDYLLTDNQSAVHQQKARPVMFWSVFIMDVCVLLGTGRPPTIRRSEIEVSVSTTTEMKLVQLDFSESVSIGNMIYPEVVRFMLYFYEPVKVFNQGTAQPNSLLNLAEKDRETILSQIKDNMLQNHDSLPPSLVFNIENHKEAPRTAQSGLFLTLHLFFFTLMALLSDIRPRNTRRGLDIA